MRTFIIVILVLTITGCSTETDDPGETPPDNDEVISQAFPDLSFTRPVDLQNAGDGTDRIFVVEQRGVVSVFPNDPSVSGKNTFLDIAGRVDDSAEEMGLLGLAFHPDFESNGYFFVNYTASGPRTVISRFQVSGDDLDHADAGSELEILTFDQPFSNHNGGQISFGPDGFLYIATGDGGGGGDPGENAQDTSNLLGNILRIDVDSPQNGQNYGIPADNPFAGNDDGYREEIFAWGLRNPWRFSFDPETANLWVADVGQTDREVIHFVEGGRNYGWNIIEGSICFPPPAADCDKDGLVLPVFEYIWGQADTGQAITGGFVYRGDEIPSLYGSYIYGDYISGRIWALDISNSDDPVNTELFNANFRIPSFGVDEQNEIHILGFDGRIYRLTGAGE